MTTIVKETKRQYMGVILIVAAAVCAFSVVSAAQDRFTLKAPGGIGFSEFRGYDSWQVIAPSQSDGSIKTILGNPEMIRAFQDGIPVNGKKVPDGAVMAKIEWTTKDNSLLPGSARVPDKLKQIGFMVKDSKRFTDTDGWGYAEFVYDATSGTFKPLGEGAAFAKTACHQCHVAGAKARDFVYTSYAPR